MKRQLHITLGLLVGAALAGFAGAGPAFAAEGKEPSVYFYPENAWTLSKPAPQRCELKNSFDNGFVVRISGSNPGKQNVDYVSIDFQQAVFGDGQSYPAKIAVPGLMERDVQAVAESARVLQVGLRGHRDLVQGFESTGAFDLKIDDNFFRFYLTGIAAGLDKFQDCTNGLSQRPALSSAAVPDKPVLQKPRYEAFENDAREGVVEVTEIMPEPSMKELKEVDLSTPPFEGRADARSARASQSERSSGSSPLQRNATNSDRFYLDRISDNEYGGMGQPEESVAATQRPSGTSSAKIDMVPMPDEPEVERSTTSQRPEPGKMRVNRDRIVAKADFTKADEKPKADPNAPFSGSFEKLETRPDGRSGTASASSRSSYTPSPVSTQGAMNSKVSELSARVQKLEAANQALKAELDDAYEATEEERLSISSENWNLERATMRYNEAERQIAALGRQLQRQKIQCEAEKKDLEAMLFDPKLTSEKQLAELSRLEAENARYKARIKALESRIGTQ